MNQQYKENKALLESMGVRVKENEKFDIRRYNIHDAIIFDMGTEIPKKISNLFTDDDGGKSGWLRHRNADLSDKSRTRAVVAARAVPYVAFENAQATQANDSLMKFLFGTTLMVENSNNTPIEEVLLHDIVPIDLIPNPDGDATTEQPISISNRFAQWYKFASPWMFAADNSNKLLVVNDTNLSTATATGNVTHSVLPDSVSKASNNKALTESGKGYVVIIELSVIEWKLAQDR
jgi:hypothetical protein